MFSIYRKPRQMVCLLIAAIIIIVILPPTPVVQSAAISTVQTSSDNPTELPDAEALPDKLRSLNVEEIGAANSFVSNLGVTEWLGPLAPVALSPFFAITILSGVAVYGDDWISSDNFLLGENSPMNNPTLFWVFLGLTVLTSLPRFSKVSKPIAQAADFLETYSAIITLLVIKFMMHTGGDTSPDPETAIVQASVASFTWDALLTIAMVINVIVINTVKFFFEFLIWITPVPFLDACFEVGNKTLCMVLMAIYTWSPLVATILNLLAFVVCFFMFAWIQRRVTFYRSVVTDIVWGWFDQKRGTPTEASLTVFPKKKIGPIPAKARCLLSRGEAGWTLTQKRIVLPSRVFEIPESDYAGPSISKGWLTCSITFDGDLTCAFSRRYDRNLDRLCELLQAQHDNAEPDADERAAKKLEFA